MTDKLKSKPKSIQAKMQSLGLYSFLIANILLVLALLIGSFWGFIIKINTIPSPWKEIWVIIEAVAIILVLLYMIVSEFEHKILLLIAVVVDLIPGLWAFWKHQVCGNWLAETWIGFHPFLSLLIAAIGLALIEVILISMSD